MIKAILTSIGYWFIGLGCFIPYHFLLRESIRPSTVGWIALGFVAVSMPFVSLFYFNWTNTPLGKSSATILGGCLVGIHLPADYLFIQAYSSELLPVFNMVSGVLVYCLFGLTPLLVFSLKTKLALAEKETVQ